MMLPSASARLWARQLPAMLGIALGIAMTAGYVGLLLSYHANLPSGPAIILTAGLAYLASLVFGLHGGIFWLWRRGRHLEA